MSLFPANDKERKNLPVFDMLVRYFPKAMREITRVCVANNVRYSPDRAPNDINWARGKSPNQLGSLFRHMLERAVDGKVFEDVPPEVTAATGIEKVYVLAEAAWRACAELELEIEREESKAAANTLVDDALRMPVYLPMRDGSWAAAGTGTGTYAAGHPTEQTTTKKPICPACSFRQFVSRSDSTVFGEEWMCSTGHAVVYFDRNGKTP